MTSPHFSALSCSSPQSCLIPQTRREIATISNKPKVQHGILHIGQTKLPASCLQFLTLRWLDVTWGDMRWMSVPSYCCCPWLCRVPLSCQQFPTGCAGEWSDRPTAHSDGSITPHCWRDGAFFVPIINPSCEVQVATSNAIESFCAFCCKNCINLSLVSLKDTLLAAPTGCFHFFCGRSRQASPLHLRQAVGIGWEPTGPCWSPHPSRLHIPFEAAAAAPHPLGCWLPGQPLAHPLVPRLWPDPLVRSLCPGHKPPGGSPGSLESKVSKKLQVPKLRWNSSFQRPGISKMK